MFGLIIFQQRYCHLHLENVLGERFLETCVEVEITSVRNCEDDVPMSRLKVNLNSLLKMLLADNNLYWGTILSSQSLILKCVFECADLKWLSFSGSVYFAVLFSSMCKLILIFAVLNLILFNVRTIKVNINSILPRCTADGCTWHIKLFLMSPWISSRCFLQNKNFI